MKTFIANTVMMAVSSLIILSCATQSSQTAEVKRDSVSQEDMAIGQSERDPEFVLFAIDDGMLKVRLSELALQKALSPEVKSFAQAMVADHGKAIEELKNLATKSSLSIPATLSATSDEKYDGIAQKDGEDFDRAYAENMVSDHKHTIEKFYVLTSHGNQSEIGDWAKTKLPLLEQHLVMAEKMYDIVKKSE